MRKKIIINDQPVLLLGDHHGGYNKLLKNIERLDLSGCIILHVGDGAEGYKGVDKGFFEKLNAYMASFGNTYLSIRGNHSNPSFFDGSVDLPNCKLLPDYSRLEINGEKWLCVGGATSIDRSFNIPNVSWWEGEKFNLDLNLIGDEHVDVLVTHCPPSWLGPCDCKGLVKVCVDREKVLGLNTLWDELVEERGKVDTLVNLVKPKFIASGHLHMRLWNKFKGDGFETKGRILAEDELLLYEP